MGAPSRLRCPICGREASPGPDNPSRPFCSKQCKLLDLDRWLSGAYRIPGPPVESDMMPSDDDGSNGGKDPQGGDEE